MRMCHVTSIEAALAIMRSRSFVANQPDPTMGSDAGLNAYDAARPLGYARTAGTGARLYFEWTGRLCVPSNVPFFPNLLYVDAWRCFVPVGTTEHLALVGFEADAEAWEEYPVNLPWHSLMLGQCRWARRRAVIALKTEIEAIVGTRPSIEVVGPTQALGAAIETAKTKKLGRPR